MRGKRHEFTILRDGEVVTDADGRRDTVVQELALGRAGTMQTRFAREEIVGAVEGERVEGIAQLAPSIDLRDSDRLRVGNAGNLDGDWEVLAVQPTEETLRVFLRRDTPATT